MSEVETKTAETGKKKKLPLLILLAVLLIGGIGAAVALLGGGEDDAWLRKALADESVSTIELNEDIKATEGYEVNGTKTIVGTGKISMTTDSSYVFSVNDGASLTVDGIAVNVMNIGANGVVVRSGGALEWKSGTLSYPKQYAVMSYGDTKISGGTFEFAGTNWLYVKSGTKAEVTGGHFVKSGAVGFEVEKDAELSISGKDTLIERAGTNTINNYGKVTLTEATISASEVWTVTNHGELLMDGAIVKDCSVKGVLYNYKDAVSAEIRNCTFSGSKTYHIYNQHEVTIKDTDMSDSGASSLNNQPGAIMNIENVTLTNCGYHAIYNDRGTMNIKNCDIDTTVYKGVQNKTGYVTIDGMTLNNVGGAGLGNVAYVTGGGYGYIHANNVTATNTVDYNVVSYGGELKLSNSVMNVTPGANVYIRNGTFELDNVQILGTKNPGKVALALGSDTYRTVEGSIKGNTVIKGSASRGVTNYGTLYIYGGTITGNKPSGTSKAGGGIYTLGKVYMYGGSITGNTALTYGGGIRVDSDEKSVGSLYMYGGSISGNKAGSNGGGISIADPACGLYLHGGTVANNVSDAKGDGILINGKFDLYNGAAIKNNDVYIFEAGQYINVKSESLANNVITVRHGALSEGTVVAKFPSEAAAAALADRFVSGNDQFTFEVDGKDLVARITAKDLESPADFADAKTVTVTTFAQLKSAVESTKGEKIIKIAADIPMTGIIRVPASASVKLIDDGTARTLKRSGYQGELFYLNNEANLYVAGTAGLTLDGASDTVLAEKPLIFATANSYVVLESGAVLQNNTNTSYATSACAGAVNLYGGRMIVDGGIIRNCNGPTYETADSGMTNRPAVYVSTTGVVSVKGGEISGSQNGAIRSYGRVYVSGGEIKDNVRSGDGGAAIRAPWIYMTGGTISGNKSTNGGGAVYLTPSEAIPEGYFYMSGGSITGNFSGVNDADPNYDFDTVGGAVYVDQNCVFDCVAGTISNNQAIGDKTGSSIGQNGGGIVNDGVVYLRSGAVVSGNYATRNGGGIFCRNKGAQLIIEGAAISGNYTDGRGGGIFSEGADNTVTITGATIENNKALGGGGILFGGGVASVTDTVFRGNEAQRTGSSYGNAGAIMNQSSTKLTLTNVTFDGNKAIAKDGGGGCGGAVYNDKADIVINGIVSKNNEARVADDIFISKNTLSNSVSGAFDVTEVYLEGSETLVIGENFTGRSDNGLILVDLPNGSSTNRYLAGEQLLEGNVGETVAALFTLGSDYADLAIGADGKIVGGQTPDQPDTPVIPEGPAAQIGEQKYDTLAEAVAAAQAGDTIVIINDMILADTLTIEKTITITTDGVADRTIYSAVEGADYYINVKADGVVITGSENSRLIIDGEGKTHQRGLVALQGAGCKLEYVTLQNNVSTYNGGGLYTNKTGGVLNSVEFINCKAEGAELCGGALYLTSSGGVTATNCLFEGNEATYRGGAVYAAGSAVFTAEGCTFKSNKAVENRGGAIYAVANVTLTLTDCVFDGNEAKDSGGAILSAKASDQLITGCTFTNNTSGNFGGAVGFSSGASTVTLDSCTFSGNTANGTGNFTGGAISVGTTVTVTGGETYITYNAAPNGYGGGIGTQKAVGTASVTVNEGATLHIYGNTQKSGGEVSFKAEDGAITNNGTLVTEAPEDPHVAKIGETGYATLAEAVAAAQSGDTVVLVSDAVLTETLAIDKAITLTTDGLGKRTVTGDAALTGSFFKVTSGGVKLSGTADSRLMIDGAGVERDSLIAVECADAADTVTAEYVTVCNAKSKSNGSAVSITKGKLAAANCIFDKNEVDAQADKSGSGGAIYLAATNSAADLIDCTFTGNKANYRGGAIYANKEVPVVLTGCVFDGNSAGNAGGAILSGKTDGQLITDCEFTDNTAGAFGGAVGFSAGASTVTLDGCTFTGNIANGTQKYAGGAISVGTALTVTGGETCITGNAAPNGYGGGIGTQKAVGTASVTVNEGATLHIYGNTQKTGGEVSFSAVDGTITNNGTLVTEAPVYPAMIGTTGYASLAEAVAAANAGDTVVICADVELNGTLTVDKAITIATDGVADRTITGSPSAGNYYINIKADAPVAIKGTAASRLIIDGESATHDRGLVAVQTADSVLEYVVLQNNINGNADNLGGALYVNKTGVALNNCVLQGNKSGGGGAAYLTGAAAVVMTNCQITGNNSTKYGGAFQGAGGSILTLKGCVVESNTASNVGGAAYMAQSSGNPATIVADGTIFKANSTTATGGVIRATGAFQLTDCTFEGNSGSDGDISEGNTTAYTRTVTNCVFDKTEGAAIAKKDPTQVVVSGCTFAAE